MAIPGIVTGFTARQVDGNVILNWSAVLSDRERPDGWRLSAVLYDDTA